MALSYTLFLKGLWQIQIIVAFPFFPALDTTLAIDSAFDPEGLKGRLNLIFIKPPTL